MRERLRIFIASCLYYSGIVRLVLFWSARTKRQLIILNYHNAEGNLQDQMRYLSRHYHILHVEEALKELYAPASVDRANTSGRDRRIPLVLTFDDGYLDNYRLAWPLAKKFQAPITIYIIPGYIESGHYFWWLAAERLLKQLSGTKVKFDGEVYQLSQAEERETLLKLIDTRLRYASSVAEREAFLASLQQELGVSLPVRSTEESNEDALPMTWEQMREMEESGLVFFGAHTVNHPVLSALADQKELQYEISESRTLLEQKLEHPILTFAYPIGKPEHFGSQSVEAVRSAGYSWAVTTIEDTNTQETDPYLLRRLPGDVDIHWTVMAAELAGLLGLVSRFRKKYATFFKK